jgi:TonB family protein
VSTRAISLYWESWALTEESDRRFNRTLLWVAAPVLLLAIVISLITLPEPVREEVSYKPERYAELLPPPPPPPTPTPVPQVTRPTAAPVPKRVETPKPRPPKPQPTPEQRQEEARRAVEKKFAAAFDQLAAMRDPNLNASTGSGPTTANIIASQGAAGTPPPAFAPAIGQGSGGIGNGQSLTGTGPGTGLGTHGTGAVRSSISTRARLAATGGAPVRTLEEIQQVFDRNKGSFYAIFNRAARENSAIGAGKIVVSLTIAPDGSVTHCEVVTSSFGDPDLERKIVERVRLLNFGAKPVPPFTYPNYPINYIPP